MGVTSSVGLIPVRPGSAVAVGSTVGSTVGSSVGVVVGATVAVGSTVAVTVPSADVRTDRTVPTSIPATNVE